MVGIRSHTGTENLRMLKKARLHLIIFEIKLTKHNSTNFPNLSLNSVCIAIFWQDFIVFLAY